jgi:hypothetical protein
MERFNALSRGKQLMLAASVLLLIDSFLAWQKYTGEGADQLEAIGADISRNMWHGWGVLAAILTLVLVVWLLVRLFAVDLDLPVSDAMTAAVLAILILIFVVIKFLADNEYRAYGAWIGLILAIVLVVGAWMAVQEAGGVDNLRTEASGMSSGMRRSEDSAPAPASPPPAAEPPSTPPVAPPPSEPPPAPPPAAGPTDTVEGDERPPT